MYVFALYSTVAQTFQGQNYSFNFLGTLSGDGLFYLCQLHLCAVFTAMN